MAPGHKRTWIGGTLLVLAGSMGVLILISGRWMLSVHTPGDRVRVSLGDELLGGGVLVVEDLKDPTASFMFNYQLARRRSDSWDLCHRLQPMAANPVMIDPKGWGVHEIPGVVWFMESQSMRVGAAIAWPIPILLAIPGTILWRRGRRARIWARRGLCVRCGYDLVATPVPDPCPECGLSR